MARVFSLPEDSHSRGVYAVSRRGSVTRHALLGRLLLCAGRWPELHRPVVFYEKTGRFENWTCLGYI